MSKQTTHQMYIITEHWISDVDFFNDELEFFNGLVDKHFPTFVEQENLSRTLGLATLLPEIQKKNSQLRSDLNLHLKHLADVIEEPFSHDANVCKNEHGRFEARMSDFVKEFRSVKKETFALSKVVLHSEKGRHLIKP